MIPMRATKPSATVTIEPLGERMTTPRQHAIRLILRLSASDPKHADKAHVAGVVQALLVGFPPAEGAPDRRRLGDVMEASKLSRTGAAVVVGVEGAATRAGRPDDEQMERVRDTLLGEGYRVAIREKRECTEPACGSEALIDWGQHANIPAGWYSNQICGKHNYRTCAACKSVYVLTSVNTPGQAPSVRCVVCGLIIIEWGGSKTWNAELVTRGTAAE